MNIGFVGAGCLGGPVSIATAMKGHEVYVYDIISKVTQNIEFNPREPGLLDQYNQIRDRHHKCYELQELVEKSELIVVVVPTPVFQWLDGQSRSHSLRSDFGLEPLKSCLSSICDCLKKVNDETYRVVEIISTVLPSTTADILYPLMESLVGHLVDKHGASRWGLTYGAAFPAQGSIIDDWHNQEFKLVGHNDVRAVEVIERAYSQISDAPRLLRTFTEAELSKQFYNTFITFKIILTNAAMEIAHKVGDCNIDNVMEAIHYATKRVISSKYLMGGLGDGSDCHYRDINALSFLADTLHLSTNPFAYAQLAREKQTEWIAQLMVVNKPSEDSELVILGDEFKPETELVERSCSVLVKEILEMRDIKVRIYRSGNACIAKPGTVYLIGCNKPEYINFPFIRPGDVVIDPWGKVKNQTGVKVIRVGRMERGQEGDLSTKDMIWSARYI